MKKLRNLVCFSFKMGTLGARLPTLSESTAVKHVYIVKLQESVLTAFKAIPFCRFRFVLFLYKALVTLLVKLGFMKAKKQLSNIEQLARAEAMLSKSGIPCKS